MQEFDGKLNKCQRSSQGRGLDLQGQGQAAKVIKFGLEAPRGQGLTSRTTSLLLGIY